mmetsp:Transcript_62987/g.146678  ORF Transcript_62987/g.146678 Transcript_62987/m.146678 type:complete len:279 (-) Transcript_62987:124-960(-)
MASSARVERLGSAPTTPTEFAHLSVRAATPGSSLPSSSSRDAPPPVLQCETLSSVSYFLQAVAVSPPPITVMAPAAVAATTSSISLLVPISNLDISNTPMGPFQMMVLDSSTAFLFSSIDFSPQSRPMNPSGMPSSLVAVLISPSSPNLEEMVKSTGKMICTPRSAAFFMMSGTILAPSSSYKEVPMAMPSHVFRKVYAMPPPMIILSTLSSIFMMSWILSLTLAPPKIANTGFAGVSRTLAKASSSLDIKPPEHFTSKPSPTMELCARCAVPKASLQ